MNTPASEILEDFICLFFPRYCAGCSEALVKGEELICTRCIFEMPRSNYHKEIENPFYNKLKGRIPVKYVMSLFKFAKAGKVQHVLHALKYRNQPEIGRLLGRIYGNELYESGFSDRFDVIVPIPLHESKKRRRGYNQSEEFGRGLSESLKISCEELEFKRITVTETQTRKSRLKRWENVKEVFQVKESAAIKDKRILLIDDVVTTGATLEAAGKVLLENGCQELSFACIAATE